MGFRDPVRTRHAVLLASVIGLRRAGHDTGIAPSQISAWRKRIEAATGERFPRLRSPGNTGHGKLTPAKAAAIRSRRARGVSWGVLARIYKISPTACAKVCKGQLYREAA